MKQSFILAIALLVLGGCVQDVVEDVTPNGGEGTELRTVEVTVSEGDTRISIDTTESTWLLRWEGGDALSGWDSDAEELHKFSMSEQAVYDTGFATFSGETGATDNRMRLVYPHKDGAGVNSTNYVIDLSIQDVDMSSDAYNSYADNNMYMVSDVITTSDSSTSSSYPTMSHIMPIITLKATGSNLSSGYVIDYITISGLENYAELQFSDGELTNTKDGDITINVLNGVELTDNETQYIPFSAVPFTINADTDNITITITFTSGESVKVVKTAPTNGSVYNFLKGTHCSLVASFDAENIGWFDGDGTYEDPYQIKSAPELCLLSEVVNAGTTYEGKYLKVMKDIDMSEINENTGYSYENDFSSIGSDSNNPFKGVFDGDEHEISWGNNSGNPGLFYRIEEATIENVTISGAVNREGDGYCGIVYEAISSVVDNCHNNMSIYVDGGGVSGVVRYAECSEIYYCSNTASIESSGDDVSGVVGETGDGTTIIGCYNTGNITGGGDSVCGVVREAYSSYIESCYNEGTIYGDGDSVSGVVGHADNSTIIYCYNEGAISGDNSFVGGVIGYGDNSSISQCYNTEDGSVSGSGDSVGGVIGYGCNCTMSEGCNNGATISGTGDYVGGVAGFLDQTEGNDLYIVDCSNTGTVYGADCVGGVMGNYTCTYLAGCNNTGSVSGTSKVGGVVGNANNSTISSCPNEGTVSGTNDIGGIVGYTYYSTISGCNNIGSSVEASGDSNGDSYGGGIAGRIISSTISECSNDNEGSVNITGNYGGGVVGYAESSDVSKSYNTTLVSGKSCIGGVVGYLSNTGISESFNSGVVNGTGSGSCIGGVVGSTGYSVSGSITNCYNVGALTGSGSYVGGIVGETNGSVISYCYNAGEFSADLNYAGGIGGAVNAWLSNCYYNSGYSGSVIGEGGVTDELDYSVIKGMTTEEMTDGTLYSYLNTEDNSGIWVEDYDGIFNSDYPLFAYSYDASLTGDLVYTGGGEGVELNPELDLTFP